MIWRLKLNIIVNNNENRYLLWKSVYIFHSLGIFWVPDCQFFKNKISNPLKYLSKIFKKSHYHLWKISLLKWRSRLIDKWMSWETILGRRKSSLRKFCLQSENFFISGHPASIISWCTIMCSHKIWRSFLHFWISTTINSTS